MYLVSGELGQTPNVHLVHGDPDRLEVFGDRLMTDYGDAADVTAKERDVANDR